jgi:hypothetical protein
MAGLSPAQYDQLEKAVARGERVAIRRRGGSAFIVIPLRLRISSARETIEARHPSTGDAMTFDVDEIAEFEVVR